VIAATSAMVMLVLDSSIVGVMLPSMRTDLHLGARAQAWIVAIYLLTLAVLLPIGGRLCDALGASRTLPSGWPGSPWRPRASACRPRAWRSSAGAGSRGARPR
jgi:MFS family permease